MILPHRALQNSLRRALRVAYIVVYTQQCYSGTRCSPKEYGLLELGGFRPKETSSIPFTSNLKRLKSPFDQLG